jgi:hypothetical protein
MTSREKENDKKQKCELELQSSTLEQILIPKIKTAEVEKEEIEKMSLNEVTS